MMRALSSILYLAILAICSGQAVAGDPVKDAYAKEYAKALADYHAIDEKLERTLGLAPGTRTNDPKIQEDNRRRAASRAELAAKQADPKNPRYVLYRCFDELRSNKIEIGMSADQVRAAICFGANSQPWHVNVTKTAAGTQEQWVYQDPPDGHVFGYLYFEGGVLVGIQTR